MVRLGEGKWDYIWVLLPGFWAIPLCYFIVDVFKWPALALLLGLFVLDPGHSYAMFLRTYFDKKEFLRSSVHIVAPLVIFSILFLWHAFRFPYLWSFIFYYTAYHYIRQYYGIFKMYQKKETGQESKLAHYALMYLPLAGVHFRNDLNFSYYTDSALFSFPSEKLLFISQFLWWGIFLFEFIRDLKKKSSSLKWKISKFGPGVLFYITLFLFNDPDGILFVLIFGHAVPYIALLVISMPAIRPKLYSSYSKTIFVVFATVVLLGLLGSWSESLVPMNDSYLYKTDYFRSLLVALIATPGVLHYYIDSVIWRQSHPDMKSLMQSIV